MMTYRQAAEYILDIPKFSSKNSMEDTRMFLKHLGSPDKNMKIIHVAGTNGKGSVCAFLSSVLCKAGYHVGTFVSPHLVTMRERFLIDRQMISEEEFTDSFETVKDALANYAKNDTYHPSFFEYLFFMAMVLFEKKDLDYVILETGLGGRLDATNSVENKLACVITSIGYDHMEYLGDTLELIAGEKAGIIREGIPVVYSDKNSCVSAVIENRAKTVKSKAYGVKKEEYTVESIFSTGIDFSFHSTYYDYIRFSMPSLGLYQAENAALALRTLEVIGGKDLFSVDVLKEGIADMFWEARMERIMPDMYLDGAHNTDGIEAFLQSVQMNRTDKKRILLYSVVKDKQYEIVLDMLAKSGIFERIGVVQLTDARGLVAEEMHRILENLNIPYVIYNSLDEAMTEMYSMAKSGEYVAYIAGSLYLAGEVKGWLADHTEGNDGND